jgi:glycosyltransferase involved in cell wall biosynthesis
MTAAYGDAASAPPTLAGSTILQIVPTLGDNPVARTALKVAHALLRVGARALVAGDEGPLARVLQEFGGEWVELSNDTANPFRLRSNARVIEQLIAYERVDIVHAHGAGAARSARLAADAIKAWVVTTLPDTPPGSRSEWRQARALSRGDRIIAPSEFAARPMMQRFNIAREQITLIPRAIDTALFDPAKVAPERVEALRNAWGVMPDEWIVLIPGRVAPWNGQIAVPELARILMDEGADRIVFAIVGETDTHRRYARSIARRATALGVEKIVRLIGHCDEMPAAFAAAHVVVIPAVEAPLLGHAAAQAQAMARPVVTTDIGILPEHVVVPPAMPQKVRTGWTVAPDDIEGMAHAIASALSLDVQSYRAMAARAREFAIYMFSPQSVAAAHRAVYTSLLARDN